MLIINAMPKTEVSLEDGYIVVSQYESYTSKMIRFPVGLADLVIRTIQTVAAQPAEVPEVPEVLGEENE